MNLGSFLLGLTGPIVARVFVSLGLTITTIGGVTVAYQQMKASLQAGVNSAPVAALQLAALAGIPEALAMVLGSITFVISLWVTTSATKIIFK